MREQCPELLYKIAMEEIMFKPFFTITPLGSSQIVTAKMLPDILLQNKCY